MKGSITKRGKNTYLIRFFAGRDPVTGKESRPTKTIHGTRKEAEKALREWIAAFESGQLVQQPTLTLNEYIETWKEVSLRPSVSTLTYETYTYDLERLVRETLGRLPISRIRPIDIQNHYVKLVDSGIGPTSVKRLHAAVSRLFRSAFKLQLVPINPAVGIDIPGRDKVKKRPVKPMDPDQAVRFLDASGNSPWLALFELALSSGMRPGEYLGLPWSCVDFEGHRVRVEQAVKRPRGREEYIGPPKTKKSLRVIPVPPQVLDALKEHRVNQAQHRLRIGSAWDGSLDLVFPGNTGGIWAESEFNAAFDYVQRLAGLEGFTPYSLRHTCATLLLAAGENVKVISERLGHSTIAQTLDTYSHVLPDMQRGASDRLASILFQTS